MNWTDKILNLFRSESGPVISGPLSFKGVLHFPKGGTFASHLEGKLTSRQDLVLGKGAHVQGDVRAENCRIQGRCEGRLDASGSVQVDTGGAYAGKLVARALRVEADAEFMADLSLEPHPVFEETPGETILNAIESGSPLSGSGGGPP